MATIKDNAIVLKLMDWSETSQIAVLLTRDHGKLSATAKGAKRQTPSVMAKFSGGLELLSRGEAVLMTKPTRELANLIEWDLADGCWPVRRDLRAFELAMYSVDLAHHLLHDHDPHPRSFGALTEYLKHPTDPAALLRYQWALIDDCGYRPTIDRDVETGEPLPAALPTLGFSASAGGLVADNGAGDRWRVRRSTVDLLSALQDGAPLDAPDEGIDRANRLLCAYARTILDKHLPTMGAVLGETA